MRHIRRALLPLLVLAALVAPSHAPALVAAGGSARGVEARMPMHRAGEVLVRFRKGANPRARQTALHQAGVVGGAKGAGVVKVARGSERAVSARLARHPAVVWAEPNYLLRAFQHSSSEVPWTLNKSQGVDAEEVWLTGNTGAGVRVAVLDSGVDPTHSELAGRVDTAANPYALADDCGHGTAVAGVIAAAHNGAQTVGVAPDSTIVPVKVLSYDDSYGECYGDAAGIAAGIRWAADPAAGNADVINMSFGHPQASSALLEAVSYARSQGVLLIAAAGDTADRRLFYPAAFPGVISVGGVARAGDGVTHSPTTSFGAVDVAAPSLDVPVVLAAGIRANRVGGPCAEGDPHAVCAHGTSFAAPHVAGVAALLVQQHAATGVLSPATPARGWQLRQWLLGTTFAVPRGETARVKLETGHGSVAALRARNRSADGRTTLVTWEARQRLLSPTSSMLVPGHVAAATVNVSDGRGTPLAGVPIGLTAPTAGSVTPPAGQTGTNGTLAVRLSSAAAGSRVTSVAELTTATTTPLPIDLRVLQADENIPGVLPRVGTLRNDVNGTVDLQDVFGYRLAAGERLEATATGVSDTEYIDLEAFGPNATDVETAKPLRENGDWEYKPLVLRRTAAVDGIHYLSVRGIGSYSLSWKIYSPRRIRDLTATPSTFSPNGDRYRDSTLLAWRLTTKGRVTVAITDATGRTRRTFGLGREPKGPRSIRWSGRTNSGSLVRDGLYKVTVQWSDGAGRYSRATTTVRVIDGRQ